MDDQSGYDPGEEEARRLWEDATAPPDHHSQGRSAPNILGSMRKLIDEDQDGGIAEEREEDADDD